MELDLYALRFPNGPFVGPESYADLNKEATIQTLRNCPSIVVDAVNGLSHDELLYAYRPEGWNIRQLVHHMADSHMNSLLRIKLALTEDTPMVPGYQEQIWATLPDVNYVDIDASLDMLSGIHRRMVAIFEHMSDADFQKEYFHAASKKTFPLYKVLALYDWHSRHHVAHIGIAKEAKSKYLK